MTSLLQVRDLTVSVPLPGGGRGHAVRGVSFDVAAGGTVGLVGESGSGKTLTSLSIAGLLPHGAGVERGQILFEQEDLLRKRPRELNAIRGRRIAMVMQDPMTALDPSFTIRDQLAEPLKQHQGLRGAALEQAVVQSLEQVRLSAARERLRQYPHQLSGGMRQRVTSAIALAGEPQLLIADEPTTALDVMTQAAYLRLLKQLQERTGVALILVTHDLLLVRHLCEQVVVMYAGRVVELGPVQQVFDQPQHPYTQGLIDSIPTFEDSTRLRTIDGQAPDLAERPTGCVFAPRCKHARELCRTTEPTLSERAADGGSARCWATEPEGWLPTR